MGRHPGAGRKRPFDGGFGPGMGPGMGGMGAMGFDGVGGPMGMPPMPFGGRGPPMPGAMFGRGGGRFGGRGGMPGRGAMLDGPAMLAKRQRIMEMQGAAMMRPAAAAGGGGVRGTPAGGGMMAGPRGPGAFAGRAPMYRNGGAQQPADPEIFRAILDAATPQAILQLWAGDSDGWVEAHLGQGLLQLAKLVEETSPDSVHEIKQQREFKSMIMAAKTHMTTMRPTDRSKVARAMGKLQYQDEDLCVALVRSMERDLAESPPVAIAGIMAGLGQVAYRPEGKALEAVEEYIVVNAENLKPKDVKDFLVAFAAIEAPPSAKVVNTVILRLAAGGLQGTNPRDLSQLLGALARMQFAPPPKFVMDCAMYLLGKLEAMATGALPPGYLDAAMVARLMTALVSFSFEPPPPLLTMVCKVTQMQMDAVDAADLADLLEIFSDARWHPGEALLTAAQAKLTAAVDEMPLVSICTSLWAFATFAFIPTIAMLKAFANRIEADMAALNAFQVCSLLWAYALFRTCTMGVWNTLVGRLRQFRAAEVNDAALKYLYQVFVLLRHSLDNMDDYQMPEQLLERAQEAWYAAQRAETEKSATEFERDMLHVLSLLNLTTVESKVVIHDGLFAVDLWVPAHELAIMCVPKWRFTANAVAVKGPSGPVHAPQPLGPTKMMQQLLHKCRVPVCMVPHHIWCELATDDLKRDFLQRQIQRASA